jgi:D-inositol-3-phosphate glycosyltransferase
MMNHAPTFGPSLIVSHPRIVLVGPAAPFRGGIAHFSNRLAQAMEEAADVRLVTFTRQYPTLLFPGDSQFEETPWAFRRAPERLLDSVNPLSWLRTGRAIADERPDAVVFVHWLPFFVPAYLGVLGAMRRRLRSIGAPMPVVSLFLHNIYPHKAFPATRALMRALVRAADRAFTLSEHVTRDAHAMRPDLPLYEGFHPVYDIFEPPIPAAEARAGLGLPDERILLFFGYIRPYKGLDVLLDAMPEIHRRTGARLIVAGEFYNNEDELRGKVKALGLDQGEAPVVRFFSQYIPNEKVHLYFSAADALVQPYRRATPSGVAQTAFFFGKPMVTTNLGVFAEVVPDGVAGVLVPPEDPAGLADGVARFYEIGPERLAEGARAQAERFSWHALVERLVPFLTGHAAAP